MKEKIDVSDLRGVLVVAFEEGLQLGKVFDIYFDRQTKQIAGISYKGRRMGFEKESFVYSDDIKKLGQDVIIVSGEKKAQPLPDELSGNGLKAMKGFMVTTDDGAHIGQIADLNVSKEEWKISELILDKEKLLEVEVGDIALGNDTIIVPAYYAVRVKEMDPKKVGIMRRLTDTEYIGETVQESVQKVGETIKKTTEKVGDAVKETSGKMGNKVRKTLKTTKPETEKTEENTGQKEPESEKERIQSENED